MSRLRTFGVTLPIAGHAYVVVKASNETEAIHEALGAVSLNDVESWEGLPKFVTGNIVHCPSPWEAEAVDETPDDENQT